MEEIKQKKTQILTVRERQQLNLNTVSCVHRFDEEEVVLSAAGGRILVEGHDLKIEQLCKETGEIVITGTIDGISYMDTSAEKRRGLFK